MDGTLNGMAYLAEAIGILLALAIAIPIVLGVLYLVYFFLTLPMRRAERARLFLDLVDDAIRQGRTLEETILSRAGGRDFSMGPHFFLVAAWLEENVALGEALERAKGFLPPPITAMLRAGLKIGNPRIVLPACRQFLKDAVSQTRGALNYLVILTFVVVPFGVLVAGMLKVVVLPKFQEVNWGPRSDWVNFIFANMWTLVNLQLALLILLWLLAICYMSGPRLASWFPFVQRFQYAMPWRRMRMRRDFSTLLALLLDAGTPEPEAVALAGSGTASRIFYGRALRAVDELKEGRTLPQAVAVMDDSGEFGWRLTNAFHRHGGFLKALSGWHESLDAKAFQQEQAAAHGITSALVLWTGVFVGLIVVSVFASLVSLINEGTLW